MHKLMMSFLIVSLLPAMLSAGISWTENLAKALSEAKQKDRIVMIDVYTDWCGWCKELDKTSYADPKVIALSKDFVNLKLNPEKDASGKAFVSRHGVSGYPTILFVDGEGTLVDKIPGYLPPKEFAAKMGSVYANRSNLVVYRAEFKKKNYKNGQKLLSILVESGPMDEAVSVYKALKGTSYITAEGQRLAAIRIGLHYLEAEKFADALGYFETAESAVTNRDEDYYRASYYRAYCLIQLGRKAEAKPIVQARLKDKEFPAKFKSYFDNLLQ